MYIYYKHIKKMEHITISNNTILEEAYEMSETNIESVQFGDPVELIYLVMVHFIVLMVYKF